MKTEAKTTPSGKAQNAATDQGQSKARNGANQGQNGNATQDGEGVAAPDETAPGKAKPPTPQGSAAPANGAAQGNTESSTGNKTQPNNTPGQAQSDNAQSVPQPTKPSAQGNKTQSTTPQNGGEHSTHKTHACETCTHEALRPKNLPLHRRVTARTSCQREDPAAPCGVFILFCTPDLCNKLD